MRNLRRTRGWLTVAFGLGLLASAGCASDSGSKEYIPGKGWKNTRAEPRSGWESARLTANEVASANPAR